MFRNLPFDELHYPADLLKGLDVAQVARILDRRRASELTRPEFLLNAV